MPILTIVRASCLVVLVTALLLAAASDLWGRVIPNGCVAAVVLARIPLALAAEEPAGTLAHSVAGMVTVLVFLLLSAAISRRMTGSAGLGGGDVKLFCALGAWAGPLGGLIVVGVSCALALCGRFACQRLREAARFAALRRGEPMPMAPAIMATMLVLLAIDALSRPGML